MAKRETVPVTERALLQRINRKLLAAEGGDPRAEQVRRSRGDRQRRALGDYYLLDVGRNSVRASELNLEEYGRKLGVLAAWERLNGE